MTKANYLDMTYDLNTYLDSVQVTKDEHGNETMDAVTWTGVTATPDYNGSATGTTEGGDGVIDSIAWATP